MKQIVIAGSVLSLLSSMAAPLMAQRAGTIEAGGFAQPMFFDDALTAKTAVGYGQRIAYFVSPRLQIEAEGSYTFVDVRPITAYTYTPLSIRAVYNQPVGMRVSLLGGIGAVRADYHFSNFFGAEGVAGARLHLTNRIALRADGVAHVMPGPRNTNVGMRLGLSLLHGMPVRERPEPFVAPVITVAEVAEPTPAPEPAPVVAVAPPTPPATPMITDRPRMSPEDVEFFRSPLVLHFGFDRAQLERATRQSLDSWIARVPDRRAAQVRIDGHTDQRGPGSYNQVLSVRRAEAVRQYLLDNGFSAERVSVAGHGKSMPVEQSRSAAAQARNRRAELLLTIEP